jgi:hypothetical protein
MLEQHLLVLGVVVLGVLRDVAELPGDPDPLRDLAAAGRREIFDLVLELLVALWCEDDFLHDRPLLMKKARRRGAVAGGNGSHSAGGRQQGAGVLFPALCR